MRLGKLNVEKTEKYIADVKRNIEIIAGINVKIGKTYLKMLDNIICHIEKNKKIYKRVVVYLASMMFLYSIPQIIRIIESTDFKELIQYMYDMPKYMLAGYAVEILARVTSWAIIILTVKDIVVANFRSSFSKS